MHYYKRNIGDYAKKAGRLSMLQHGAYTLLIDACYDREQFPTLEDAIDWTWASSTAEVEAVEFVLRKFFTLVDGRYVQQRIADELASYHATSETNKRIAQEREAKRHEASTKRERSMNEAPPNHKPLTINQEPLDTSTTVDVAANPSCAANESAIDNCPHQQIIALYHQHLPTAIRVREWTPARAQSLRSRWREKPQRQNLEWWGRLFEYISESDFLMGRKSSQGRKPFEIDLEWICQSKNFVKIIEGKFHEMKEVAA